MYPISRAVCTTLALAVIAPAQIISYKSYEDYCYHNPDAGSCYKGKPLDINSMQLPPGFQLTPDAPKTPAAVRPQRSQTPAPAPPSSFAQAPTSPVTPPQVRHKRGAPADIRLGELDWRLVQPEADVLIGLNMAGLAESELARSLIGQWAAKLGATDAEQQKLLAALGDIPQAVISIQRKEVLAVLMGHVDDFANQSTIGGLQTVRVSADTIVVGSQSALKWAMFRLNFKEALPAPVQDAKELARTNDFWAVGKPQAFAALGQGIGRDTPIKRLKLGVSFQDRFRMDIFLETADPAVAAKILQSSQKGEPRGMTAGVEGNAVHFALLIDRDTALQRFAGFMTDPIGKNFAPLLTAARQMAARQGASTRSAPGKIVIDGLDDGPREIPATPRR